MAVTGQTGEKIFANQKMQLHDFDPGGTDPLAVATVWLDMRDWGKFAVGIMRTVGTSNIDTFDISASANADGSSSTVIKAHAVGSEPNAVEDQLWLEITAEMLAANSVADLRYVNGRIEFATGTDEMVCLTLLKDPRFAKTGQTVDIVA